MSDEHESYEDILSKIPLHEYRRLYYGDWQPVDERERYANWKPGKPEPRYDPPMTREQLERLRESLKVFDDDSQQEGGA